MRFQGMVMLGLFELMASQNATTDEMFLSARQDNFFWFTQQTLEQAIYFKTAENKDCADMNARQIVGIQYSSESGFRQFHQWLAVSHNALTRGEEIEK